MMPDATPDLMIRGGLVEPKHWKKMGEAVWLYLYFHRVVRFDGDEAGKTFAGRLYQHQDAVEAIGAPRRRIERWFAQLLEGRYISVVRRRLGYEVTITKYQDAGSRAAIRRTRHANGGVSPQPEIRQERRTTDAEIRQNRASDTPKSVERYATGGVSIYGYQAIQANQAEVVVGERSGIGEERPTPPPELAELDRALRPFPEYQPTADYYAAVSKVVGQIKAAWPDFDLAVERVKLLDHYRRKGGGVGIGNVLNWLANVLKDARREAAKAPRAGAPLPRDNGVLEEYAKVKATTLRPELRARFQIVRPA